ncbi:MAG: LysM peptidoglycan-binding domain-containing protein [bacterium]
MRFQSKLTIFFVILCMLLFVVSSFGQAQDEREIKMKDYKVQLAELQAEEEENQAEIERLEADIDSLESQIAEVQSKIDTKWDEIYTMLGTDEASVNEYRQNLEDIDSEMDGLAALSPEELFRSKDELKDLKNRIEEAKNSNIYLLTEMENKIEQLEGKAANLCAKMPANIFDKYTVVRGDNLWDISKKDDIYGNPYQWIRIYCVNKDQIKDADLIYPEQIFNIARGVAENEHLVVKGEFLSKIAGMAEVFGDPTKWTELYEANNDVIEDANIIYPYQVITIPKN